MHQAFKRMVWEKIAPEEGVGRLQRLEKKKKVPQPGEVICIKATVKLTWNQPGLFVVLETDSQQSEAGVDLA